ncbi:MAG: hypothetical protein ABSA05_12315 [Opitutaceae bacterium]|jgi:hypothetical protein
MGARRTILGAVLAISVALAAAAFRLLPPPLPSPLRLAAVFSPGVAGRSDPLLVSGRSGDGDFLYVRFSGPDTAVFGYDSWGVGGPASKPVKLEAGLVHHLEIAGPMLTEVVGRPSGNPRLRVVCDGSVVLDANVSYHVRTLERIFVGWNPIGGTSCGQSLHGSLRREDGKPLPGRWSTRSMGMRFLDWWTAEFQRIVFFLLLAAGGIFGGERLSRLGWPGARARAAGEGGAFRRHACFAAAAFAAALVFSYFVTDGNFNFDFPEVFGNFYDYQAAGLLRGRFDVPPEAIPSEGFIVHGKTYGYFGPTPALMRIPFASIDLAFGKLSRGFMLLDYLGCLVFAYLILRLAVRMLRGENAVPSHWSIVLLVVNAGLGSTLLFLGSRAYIYHEAILCGAAFALAASYFSLRHLARPEGRAWMPAWACGVLSLNARPTVGLFALSFLGCAALAVLIRSRFQPGGKFRAGPAVRALAIGASCAIGLFSYSLVSYAKFGTFFSLPLKYHVQYTPERLARFGGKNFALGNLACNLDGYVWGPNFMFQPKFPYFYAKGPNQAEYPGAKIDIIENIVGLPYAMPGLFFLALGGSALAVVRARRLGWALAVAWGAAIPLCMALFTAVAMSHRYTGDFCPFLIVAAALGLAACEEVKLRAIVRMALAILTLWSILATLALTFEYQGEAVWGVPDEARARFQRMRSGMDHLLNPHPRP